MSVAGTMFHGYFFAFHLLNIVNNNQLLGGVIKAVTQNGEFYDFTAHVHTKRGYRFKHNVMLYLRFYCLIILIKTTFRLHAYH